MAALKCPVHGTQERRRGGFCPICMEPLVPDEPEPVGRCAEPGCGEELTATGCAVHSLRPAGPSVPADPGMPSMSAPPRPTRRDGAPEPAVVAFPWGSVLVGAGQVWIGRDTDCELAGPLAKYDNVSRRHAVLWRDGPDLYVQDQESMNGTYVNERKIEHHQPIVLREGDSLRFGAELQATVLRQGSA
jgi:hypothetical protein